VTKLPRLYVVMLRYRVAAMVAVFLLVGAAQEGELHFGTRYLFAALALASSYVSATALNDLADEGIDRINHPRDAGRPLVEGTAVRRELAVLSVLAGAVALVAALPLGRAGVALIAASLAISQAYSARPLRISYRVGGAPPTLGVAYVVIPYALGVVAERGELGDADPALLFALVLLFAARIVLKDFRDRAGDAAFGKATLLLRFGKTATCAVSGLALAAADVVLAVAVSGGVWLLLQPFVAGIAWMLFRLWRAGDPVAEQVAIGIGARLGNGLLLTMLAWLVTGGMAAAAFVTAIFLTSFASLASHPDAVVVGYKG
jgi:4-hydroxybenzoate polyprenyltransferase